MPDPEPSLFSAGGSLADALRLMTAAFARGGIETPAVDARLLAAAALAISKEDLIVSPQRLISIDEAHKLQRFIARRLAHEPVSRILGAREFYGRSFTITPDTLDPRPDSETLIEATMAIVRERGLDQSHLRIVDIGTGTGCLLLTLLSELPQATGLGTDVSQVALDVAAGNAERLGVSSRVQWRVIRSLEGLDEAFDVLVSNPPYVETGRLMELEPGVRLYDPQGALDGGGDGLQVYREIARGLAGRNNFAAAVFEVGSQQCIALKDILIENLGSQIRVRTWKDLGGHTRCVAVETHW